MKFASLRKECYEANMDLPKLGLVIYTFGNVSCIDRKKGVFAIKPSGVDYEKLTPEDIVIVGLDGKIVDGKLRPSSDTNTHLELYKAFPSVGGIVHTHSTFAVAWAQAARAVPLYGTTHADHLAADIPCTEFMADDRIRNDYETETGLQIIDCFKKRKLKASEIPMALVAGHGPFTWGATAAKAVYHARVLEELCKMAFVTECVNPKVPRLKDSLIQKHYNRKHGKDAYYGQN
jgi:L-ribulose-5-phosphate 4-epimerase